MKTNNKIIGLSLIIGGFLQMTRMMPIAMSDGIKMLENFPPHNVDEILNAAHSSGWFISHIMVFIASAFLMTGFYGVYQKITSKTIISSLALITLSIGLILYNIGAVIDGLFLPIVGHELIESATNTKEIWGVLANYTHEFAVNFGGLAFAHLLLGTGVLGISLLKVDGWKYYGIIGIVLGALALIGYITGILDIRVTGSFMLTGGLTMLMFIFYFILGFKVYRHVDNE